MEGVVRGTFTAIPAGKPLAFGERFSGLKRKLLVMFQGNAALGGYRSGWHGLGLHFSFEHLQNLRL